MTDNLANQHNDVVGRPLAFSELTDNKDRWENVYYDELVRAVNSHPDEYAPDTRSTDGVWRTYNKMLYAFERGTYNKDSRAIRATCKRLGIPHTYKAINAYMKGE